MADEKKDDKAEAAAPAKDDKKSKKPKKPKDLRFHEAGWNAFGAIFLAGFGMTVTAMSSASFAGGKEIVTIMTLVGGIVIFALSAIFAKMTVTEFGKALTKAQSVASPAETGDTEEKDAPKGKR